MLQFPEKAKICKNLRKNANLALFVPFSLSLLIGSRYTLEVSQAQFGRDSQGHPGIS